jgi:hypothetical protein
LELESDPGDEGGVGEGVLSDIYFIFIKYIPKTRPL